MVLNIVLCYQVEYIEFWCVYFVDGVSLCCFEFSFYWLNLVFEEINCKFKKNLDMFWEVMNIEDMLVVLQIFENLKLGVLLEVVYGRNELGLVYYYIVIG